MREVAHFALPQHRCPSVPLIGTWHPRCNRVRGTHEQIVPFKPSQILGSMVFRATDMGKVP